MSTADETAAPSTLEHHPPAAAPVEHHRPGTRNLDDREAVIAAMTADGVTCEDITSRLSLPLQDVEAHLSRNLSILDPPDVRDLTYVVVAAHYNRRASETGHLSAGPTS